VAGTRTDAEPLVAAESVSSGYGSLAVLHEIDLHVRAGEVVALVGANGAGKTTLLLTLAGVIPTSHGTVRMYGEPTTAPLHRRARRGLRLITEDRAVFSTLPVKDNLRIAHKSPAEPLALFPELEPLLRRRVGLLSGGEQQMLTLARALTGSTRLLLADELSLGLAPLVVRRLLRAVRQAADERGVGVLLVDQQVRNALSVADRVYVMQRGRVVLSGTAPEMSARLDEIEASYLTAR
jgi:branched-chain amino acid transport system ATP-binding protein